MATIKSGGSSKRSGGSSSKSGGASKGGSRSSAGGASVGNNIAAAADSAVSEVSSFNWSDALERIGLSEAKLDKLRGALDEIDVSESIDKASEYLSQQVEKARDYTRKNPKTVAGGAAGVLVGASLLAYALSRGGSKKKGGGSSSKKASSSKKSSGSSSKKASGSSSKKSGGSSSKKSSK